MKSIVNSKVIKDILDKNFDFDEIAKDFPIIYELKNIEQNPKYHEEGNVYIHTKEFANK